MPFCGKAKDSSKWNNFWLVVTRAVGIIYYWKMYFQLLSSNWTAKIKLLKEKQV